jgi:hypothetical protein
MTKFVMRALTLILGFVSLAAVAQTTTPNLQLNLPSVHSLNWNTRVNGNFSILDSVIGGQTAAPWSFRSSTPYSLMNSAGTNVFKVDLSGNVTTYGMVTLSANPTTSLQAATKNYVDNHGVGTNIPLAGYLYLPETAGTGGVVAGALVKLNSTGQVVTVGTTDTGALGIVVVSAAAGSTAQVAIYGMASCIMDNSTTIGDLVTLSTTTGGYCHDTGTGTSSNLPITQAKLGRVLTAVAAQSQASIELYGPGHQGTQLVGVISSTQTTPQTMAGALNVPELNNAFHTLSAPSTCTINSVNYTTKGDCAAYAALAAASAGINQVLVLDSGETDTCAGWNFNNPSNGATVSIVTQSTYGGGESYPITTLKQTCNIGSTAVITYPTPTTNWPNLPSATVRGLVINANNNAGACLDFMMGSSSSKISDLNCINVTSGSDHLYRFGNSTAALPLGWMAGGGNSIENLHGRAQGLYNPNFASGQVTISAGSATGVYTLITGGSGFTNPKSTYSVQITGWGVGVTQNNGPSPCTTLPTGTINSFTSGVVTLSSITFSGGTGCDPNNTYFIVQAAPTVNRIYWFDKFSDGTASNLEAVGPTTTDYYIGSGSGGFILDTPHGWDVAPTMIALYGNGVTIKDPLCDGPEQVCIVNFGQSNTVHGGYRIYGYGGGGNSPGAGDFWTSGHNSQSVTWGPTNGCQSNQTAGGYNTFGTTTGPFDSTTGIQYGAIISDVTQCTNGNPVSTGGPPPVVTMIPTGASIGGKLHFTDANESGDGFYGECEVWATGSGALGRVATPGFNPLTGIITIPAGTSNNGGYLSCVERTGYVWERGIPNTGSSTQTFNMSNLKTGVSGTQRSFWDQLNFDGQTQFNYGSLFNQGFINSGVAPVRFNNILNNGFVMQPSADTAGLFTQVETNSAGTQKVYTLDAVGNVSAATVTTTSLTAPALGNIVLADGFSAGTFAGAWSSATYPACTAVTYAGVTYVSTEATTNVVPGTGDSANSGAHPYDWIEARSDGASVTPTGIDCADFITLGNAERAIGTGVWAGGNSGPTPTLLFGSSSYITNTGLIEADPAPKVNGTLTPNRVAISYQGQGIGATSILQGIALPAFTTSSFPTGMITLPWVLGSNSAHYAPKTVKIDGIALQASFNAPYALDIQGFSINNTFNNLQMSYGTQGNGRWGLDGNLDAWVPQSDFSNLYAFPNSNGSGAFVSCTVSGGVPTCTVTSGGSGYTSNTLGFLLGNAGGTTPGNAPCSNMGTNTVTLSGGVVTGFTTTATGCPSVLSAWVWDSKQPNAAYGFDFQYATDSTFTNILSSVGSNASMRFKHGNNKVIGAHPESGGAFGIENGTFNTYYGTNCGEQYQGCFNLVSGPAHISGSYISTSIAYPYNAAITISGSLLTQKVDVEEITCSTTNGANFSAANEYHTFASNNFVWDNGGIGGLAPAVWNAQYCGPVGSGGTINTLNNGLKVTGDISGTGNATFALGSVSAQAVYGTVRVQAAAAGTATSGTNYSSSILSLAGSYYNGGPLSDGWNWINVVGTGSTPTSQLSLSHAGSSGLASVYAPYPWNIASLSLNNGTPITSTSSTNSQVVTCPTGGSGTQYCDAAGVWVTPSTSTAFSALTTGTNTTAALTIGSGSSLTYSGSGTNNASSLGGIVASSYCQTSGTNCPSSSGSVSSGSAGQFAYYASSGSTVTGHTLSTTDIANLGTLSNSTTGNAATATTASSAPYSGLTGTVPTWNQNTTGNAATATNASNLGGVVASSYCQTSGTNCPASSYSLGGTPSCSGVTMGSAAGTGATCSGITGFDASFLITFLAGSPQSPGQLFSLNFSTSRGHQAWCTAEWDQTLTSLGLLAQNGSSPSSVVIYSSGATLSNGISYAVIVHCP